MNSPTAHSSRAAKPIKKIGFRLDDESAHILSERAARETISVHDLSRRFTLEGLHSGEERIAVAEGLLALHHENQEVKRQLHLIAEALLIGAGKASPEDANKWVQQNLSTE